MRKLITRNREMLEIELLGILSNYPSIIDKLNFRKDYFKIPFHRKIYTYLSEVKEMDYQKMLEYMNENEADEFVTKIYANNIYEKSSDSMAMGFAKLILEEYKQEEIDDLDDKRKLDMIFR